MTDLHSYANKLFLNVLQAHNVPGGIFVFVKDGKLVDLQGFGYANLSSHKRVDPVNTQFRVGSIAKPLTAMLVMKLVEDGRLSLDADVNEYLEKFKIPTRYASPITLRNLLSHSAGFDNQYIGVLSRLDEPHTQLEQFLAENLPERVAPPGKQLVYSNYGMALAGYIAEKRYGRTFDELASEALLRPLGMTDTQFGIEGDIPPRLATPYADSLWGKTQPVPYVKVLIPPAGDLITTGPDIAKFMMLVLNNCNHNGKQILKPDTCAKMLKPVIRNAPGLDGWTLGLEESTHNGWHAVVHGGNGIGFGSVLFLVPEDNSGFFASFNKQLDRSFVDPIENGLVNFLYPPRQIPQRVTNCDSCKAVAKLTEGTYWTTQRARHDYSLIYSLFTALHIHANSDGTLRVDGFRDTPRMFYPITGERWYEPENAKHLAPLQGSSGEITGVAIDEIAFDKVPWYRHLWVSGSLLGIALIFSLVALFTASGAAASASTGIDFYRLASIATAACVPIMFVLVTFAILTTQAVYLVIGPPPTLTVAFAVPILAIIGAGLCCVLLARGGWELHSVGLASAAVSAAILFVLSCLWNVNYLSLMR